MDTVPLETPSRVPSGQTLLMPSDPWDSQTFQGPRPPTELLPTIGVQFPQLTPKHPRPRVQQQEALQREGSSRVLACHLHGDAEATTDTQLAQCLTWRSHSQLSDHTPRWVLGSPFLCRVHPELSGGHVWQYQGPGPHRPGPSDTRGFTKVCSWLFICSQCYDQKSSKTQNKNNYSEA